MPPTEYELLDQDLFNLLLKGRDRSANACFTQP